MKFQAENIIYRPKNVPFRVKFGFTKVVELDHGNRIRPNSTIGLGIPNSKNRNLNEFGRIRPSLVADIYFLLFWSPKPFTSFILKTLLVRQNVC